MTARPTAAPSRREPADGLATGAPGSNGSLPGLGRTIGWLRGSRAGLFTLALLVGTGAGLGAVAFRYLISGFTWLATGHAQFGQQGYRPSGHLPWLGLAFFVLIPAVGGLIYGPLIYRFAREARGHGVPEVMIAVAENGGRIRPQVSVVKAVASALCIGTGGSVGREGPIVQIGSALASSLGQWVRMPENRLRILVACGAGGGIAATFNAPVTGVFFGVEIILREFSVEALFMVMLSAMVADVIGEAFLGGGPFLSGFPTGIALHSQSTYLLVAVLAVIAALIGWTFTKTLYAIEDLCDRVWSGRPEWARPAVGGILLGVLLLALPQLYGVGYPVMYQAVAGGYALWFLILLAVGKMLATGLSIGIGGSGGVFAPSLFLGVTSGMAFGEVADHLFGSGAGQPGLYAAVAMGAVFTAAARAPLTSLASVVEMTGDHTLTLPVMLAVAIASTLSRALSYGTIYTTKLLRRGTDIDQPAPWQALADLKVTDAMHPLPAPLPVPGGPHRDTLTQHVGSQAEGKVGGNVGDKIGSRPPGRDLLPGRVIRRRDPQVLFAGESLAQALRQLLVYDQDGLPVLSTDGHQIQGWLTEAGVITALARRIHAGQPSARQAVLAAEWARPHPDPDQPTTPLPGYQILDLAITADTPAAGARLGALTWPGGHTPVLVHHDRRPHAPDLDLTLTPGDHVTVLARTGPANVNGTTRDRPRPRGHRPTPPDRDLAAAAGGPANLTARSPEPGPGSGTRANGQMEPKPTRRDSGAPIST